MPAGTRAEWRELRYEASHGPHAGLISPGKEIRHVRALDPRPEARSATAAASGADGGDVARPNLGAVADRAQHPRARSGGELGVGLGAEKQRGTQRTASASVGFTNASGQSIDNRSERLGPIASGEVSNTSTHCRSALNSKRMPHTHLKRQGRL